MRRCACVTPRAAAPAGLRPSEGSPEHARLRGADQSLLGAVPRYSYASAPKNSAHSHMRRSAVVPGVTVCLPRACWSCTAVRGRAVCSAEQGPKHNETPWTILQTLGRDNGRRQSVLLAHEDQRRAAATTAAAVHRSELAYFDAGLFEGDGRSVRGRLHCGLALLRSHP